MPVLSRPTKLSLVGDALLDMLTAMYEAIVLLKRTTTTTLLAVATHADARKVAGTSTGPFYCFVAGRTAPLDGGEGAYVWDPTSALADNDTTVLAVAGVPLGRWRKASL